MWLEKSELEQVAEHEAATEAALEQKDGGSVGPIYGVPLIDSLPLGCKFRGVPLIDSMPDGSGFLRQQMPSRSDLMESSERVAAGYEVLLAHYQRKLAETRILQELAEFVRFSIAHRPRGGAIPSISEAIRETDNQLRKLYTRQRNECRCPLCVKEETD